MAKVTAKATNERREKVWFLMLKGHNAQSMSETLNVSHVTIYNDIKSLTKKSKQYIYDMAKGTHVLMYQRSIEGIGLTLAQAWDKFNDPKVPEKQKVSYLRLRKECNEVMFELTANGPTEMAVLDIMRHADRLGLDYDINKPLMLTEQEQIRNYIMNNRRFNVRNGYDYTIPYDSSSNSNKTDIRSTSGSSTTSTSKDDLNHAQQ